MTLSQHRHSEASARRIVKERSRGRCETCGAAETLDWAHRVPKGQGGPWCPSNGLAQCRSCHRTSEGNPLQAYAKGIRLRSHLDPHLEPVYLGPPAVHVPGWWLLDELGGYIHVEVTFALPHGLVCRHCRREIHIDTSTNEPIWVHSDTSEARCQPHRSADPKEPQ